jgi:hypothetical protein
MTVCFVDSSCCLERNCNLWRNWRVCRDLLWLFFCSTSCVLLLLSVSSLSLSPHSETRLLHPVSPHGELNVNTRFRTDITFCGRLKVKSSPAGVICWWHLAFGTYFRHSLWFVCLYSLSEGGTEQEFGLVISSELRIGTGGGLLWVR